MPDIARPIAVATASLWLGLSSLAGEDDAVWRQGFEDRLPGELPAGWHRSWGEMPTDDIIAVTNVDAVEGRRSLLLDRAYGGLNGTHYGFLVNMPSVDSEWAQLSFCFLAQGPRHQTTFSFEVRTNGGGRRVAVIVYGKGVLTLQSGDFKKSVPIANAPLGAWHRATLRLPTTKAGPGRMSARLERREDDGLWSQTGELAALDAPTPIGTGNGLMLCAGATRGYKLLVDDIILSRSSPPSP